MRFVPTTLALLMGASASTAIADPCGKPPSSTMKVADSWQAVYALMNEGKKTAATPAEATQGLCRESSAEQPCGPDAPISVVYAQFSTVALAFRNPNNTYAVLTLPVILSPNAHSLTLKTLAKDLLHVDINWAEYGREMVCDEADMDADGNCVQGMSATVSLGHTYIDMLVNPIARTMRWERECMHDEEGPRRASAVTRMPDKALAYSDCNPLSDPQWFAFVGGKCTPANASVDVAGALQVARAAAKTGDFKAAVSRFDSILHVAPGRTDYLSERGYLRFKAGDLTGALVDLKAARETRPKTKMLSVIEFNTGLVKMARGDAKGALQAFTFANRLRPTKAAQAKIAELKAAPGQPKGSK